MDSTMTTMGYSFNELILAFINLAIVLGDAVKNRKKTYYGYRLLRLAAFSYMLNLLGALQWSFTDGNPGIAYMSINWLGCSATVLAPVFFSASCALYIDYAIHRSAAIAHATRTRYHYIFGTVIFIFLASLPFGGIFSLDANNTYQRGVLMPLYFLLPLAFQCHVFLKIIKHRKRLNEKSLDFGVLLLICGMVVCGFMLQWLNASGEMLFFHSIAMITMFLKVNHDARLEKEKLYKASFNGLNVALAIFDSNDRYEYANPFYLKNSKLTVEDTSFESFEHFIRTQVAEKTRAEVLNEEHLRIADVFYRTKGRYAFQGMAELGDNVYFITLLDVVVLEETYKVVCYTDMTDYMRVKNELDESISRTNLYEKAFESANYGVSIFSAHEKINYINKYYANLIYGKDPHELIGGDIFSLCDTPDKLAKWRQMFQDAVTKQSGHVCIPAMGKLLDFSYDVVTIYNAAKEEENYICLLQDITENKRMEHQIAEQVQRLETLSKAKDEFIANVSHEIRTPINAIIGMIYFMKNTVLSQEQINYVNKIDNAAGVLLSLVNDVLDFSKFNANKITLQNHPFKLLPVVESVKAMFETTCREKSVALSTHCDFDWDLAVCGDKVRFSQVILNFVSNAVKFTNQGSIKIGVQALETTENLVSLKVSVSDTGVGIAPENLKRVWQSFEQVDNSLSKRYQGTGLGLAISKQIVTQMGGEIWVESLPDEGSTFGFTVDLERSQIIVEEVAPKDAVDIDISGRRILLVEDNEINAEIASAIMEQLDLRYDLAGDGIEAIEHCTAHAADYYDLILMDIHMPRMNGYEAAVKIRDELRLKVPIIALSATVENPEMQKKYARFIDGYLTKPIQPIVLKDHLSQLLAKPGAQGAVAVATTPDEQSLDIRGAAEILKRLGGNETLLRHLLGRFKTENENITEKIRYLYLERKIDQLLILLSHLRNSAKNLDLQEIDDAADRLIWSLKNDEVVAIDKYTEQIQQALDTIFH